ncbi:rod shape-determining protein MreC [Motilibacter peucedani]|uniref:Cell shape-determining protein MreC n=1 Tax=Motilibacter peucedani TaxID=598650 RepID=A0A420XNR8_9ACTN|nr:rod shape-determining protein MreC [Motilibacter peucedani]RKS73837.1 rod shape-determining protein MreC [Motilibacter peucedani]
MGRDSRRTRLVLTLLLLTSLTLLLLDGRSGGSSPASKARDAAGTVLGPVERAASAVTRGPRNVLGGLSDLGTKDATIRDLRAENDRLRQAQALQDDTARRLREWEQLTRSPTVATFPVEPARVIALSSAQGFSTTATIDAGSADGVRVDTTVVGPGSSGRGLVGRVVAVQARTSTVLLATDPDCYVGIRRAKGGGLFGGVAGTGGGRDLELTGFEPDPPKVGEALVSAGSPGDAPFVKDVLVGTVTVVRTAPGTSTTRATVRPAVDFAHLDLVGVVVPPTGAVPRASVPRSSPR